MQTDLSRHDHHRIEIKLMMDLGGDDSLLQSGTTSASNQNPLFRSQMDIFLFMPKSVHLTSWPKSDLLTDFHSHVRLSVPLHHEGGQAVLEDVQRHLKEALSRFLQHDSTVDTLIETTNPYLDELIAASKELAAVVGETLKRFKSEHSKALARIISSGATTESKAIESETILFSIEAVATMIASVRNSMGPLDHASPSVVRLLDEFISSLYIQYLGKMRSCVARSRSPRLSTPFHETLDRLQTAEAEHRNSVHAHLNHSHSERELEHELARLSQLKKFFQSSLFFDVTYREAVKALNRPIAAGAAALAASWAILFQQLNNPTATDIGLKGVSFICVAIVAYVLKDLLKDWAKNTFAARASRIFADIEQQLYADHKNIGLIREWFRILRKEDVPSGILQLRAGANLSEVERTLPEDVFHYKRHLELRSVKLGNISPNWGIRENLRINLERYLRHMDDPFKDIAFLDQAGRLTKRRSHRVYHFYACIRLSYGNDRGARSFDKLPCVGTSIYRIIMDKNGVDRIEEVSYSANTLNNR